MGHGLLEGERILHAVVTPDPSPIQPDNTNPPNPSKRSKQEEILP